MDQVLLGLSVSRGTSGRDSWQLTEPEEWEMETTGLGLLLEEDRDVVSGPYREPSQRRLTPEEAALIATKAADRAAHECEIACKQRALACRFALVSVVVCILNAVLIVLIVLVLTLMQS